NSYRHIPHSHSFPTRRSSDLTKTADGVTLTDYSYDPLYLAGEGETASGKIEIWNTADQIALYESSYVGRVSDEIYESLKGSLERSEEHTSELQSRFDLVCRLL